MNLLPTRLSLLCWTFALALFLLALSLYYNSTLLLMEWTIINPLSSPIKMLILCDPKGLLFAATVMLISANVFLFSSSYMAQDPFLPRFSIIVFLFVMSMILLIFIPHMMCLLLGWDGLGLVSFALVIYYQNPKSLAAGMITALTNRIGDVMLLMAIAWSLSQGHWTITNMSSSSFNLMITIFIALAAMTKSAQMPFSSWLPAAMAAPTPVSALVHSSTLVTAGVFLLIRFYSFVSLVPFFSHALLLAATLTMLMASLSAMAECDLKKIIALSTLSQLGVMMMSLALHLNMFAFFHLLTHALFKSLLFLTAGTIINLFMHSQDLRTTGHLSSQLPLTTSCMLTANLALCGFPFLAGFYSKDMILEFMLASPLNLLIATLALLATALTTAYSLRFMLTLCWNQFSPSPLHSTQDTDPFSSTPMLWLALTAILAGSTLNWMIVPAPLEPVLTTPLKLIPLMILILGIYLGLLSTRLTFSTSPWALFSRFHLFTTSMWFLTPLSSQHPTGPTLQLAKLTSHTLDSGWWEMLLPQASFKSPVSIMHLLTLLPSRTPPTLIAFSAMIFLSMTSGLVLFF